MKRLLSVLLSLCLLCAALGGCQYKDDSPTATVLTGDGGKKELPLVTMLADVWVKESLPQFLKSVPGYGQEFHVEYELLDEGGSERDMRLVRLRTEMMAGGGPDLFFCDQYVGVVKMYWQIKYGISATESDPMFNFPEQAMGNHLFLPLDDYMENAQFTEFDKLLPVVMEAGRTEEGQVILPVTYSFDVGYFRNPDFTPETAPKTHRELLDADDVFLNVVGADGYGDLPLNAFSPVEFLEAEEPAFSQEDLTALCLEYRDVEKQYRTMREDYHVGESPWMGYGPLEMFLYQHSYYEGDVIVPTYNQRDGITAYVSSFAAINRNASYPDYAFRVLDKLLSVQEQQEARIYGDSQYFAGLPTHTEAGGAGMLIGGRRLNEEVFRQYTDLRKKITETRFLNMMDREAMRLADVCVQDGVTEDGVRAAAHKTYMTMRMMLAES